MSDVDPTAQAQGLGSATLDEPPSNGHGEIELSAPPREVSEPSDVAEEAEAIAVEVADEPTAAGDLDDSALIGLGVRAAAPLPQIAKRRVRGRYRSVGTGFQVELRVDVDGPRPMKRVSADYYSVSGGTTTYFGSMRVDVAAVTIGPALVTITGTGRYTFAAGAPKVKVTIPRVAVFNNPAAATLRHFTTGGAPAAVYVCRFQSVGLRSVLLEEDVQQGVTRFPSYNTGSLPSGGPARTLSTVSAYAEAGVQMLSTGMSNTVATADAGANASWSDAELHAAMQKHFSKWQDLPQWAVWLLHARLHDIGPNLYGIMFDQQGRQRQGCAVFYESLAGTSADRLRLQLYTCVHELGHCFNLLHSWQKSFADPPVPNRPASPSWMNYPWNFPGGPAAFWAAFAFQFDDPEVIHIRHAFRDDVIMGGNPFTVGSALENDPGWRDPEVDDSGLRLELSAPRAMPYGVPVAVDLALRVTSERARQVPPILGPRPGLVDIAIRTPGGRAIVFEPLLQHCLGGEETVTLRAGDEPVRDSAFIHYGKGGFTFDQPGMYRLRARYAAPDGSLVVSDVVELLVQAPVSQADNEVAELIFGDEQGTLLSLVGSDAPELQRGNDALQEIVDRHGKHPAAAVARVVLGTNAAREFKHVEVDGSVSVREPQPEEAASLLGATLQVDALREAASGAEDEMEARSLAAAELPLIGTKKAVPSYVDAYLRSRRHEIVTEVVELS
jgi:hypothetical protein